MSFLLDRAIDFVKYGPLGNKKRTKEQNELYHRETTAARKYQRAVLTLLNRGITEQQLRKRKVWVDEWMKPRVAGMGGGPGLPGAPVIPTFITSGSSRPEEKVDPATLAENEAKTALLEHVNESVGNAPIFTILSAIDEANENIHHEEKAIREPISAERAEREALFPEIYNAGHDLQYPQNGWQGARRHHKPGKPDEKYTTEELKDMYAKAIADMGGGMVDPTYVRDILRMLLQKKQDLTNPAYAGETTEITNAWNTLWGNATLEQRSRFIRSLNIAGLFFPSTHHKAKEAAGEKTKVVDQIKSNANLLNHVMNIAHVQFPNIFKIFRMEDLTAAARDIESQAEVERKEEPPRSTAEWIEEKTPYFRQELMRTGMDVRLQNVVLQNLRDWSQEFGGLLIGDNPEMEYKHVQERAIVGLIQYVRRAVNTQLEKDKSIVFNPVTLLDLVRIVFSSLPSNNLINSRVLSTLVEDAKNEASRAYDESGSRDDFDELRDMNRIGDVVDELVRDINGMRVPADERLRDVSLNPEHIAERSTALRGSNIGTGEEKLAVLTDNTIHEIKRQAENSAIAIRIGPVSIIAQRAMRRVAEAFRPRPRVQDIARENEVVDRIRRLRALIIRLEEQERGASLGASRSSREYASLTLREAIKELRDTEAELAYLRGLPTPAGHEENKHNTEDRDEQLFEESAEDIIFASRNEDRVAAPGAPGGEPNPDGGFLGIEVDLPSGRRIWRAHKSKITKLLLLLGAIGASGVALKDQIANILERADSGEVVEVKVDGGVVKEEPKKSKEYIPSDTGVIGTPSISGTNGMTDTATYEMGIDGKPKLFTMPSHGLSYTGPADTNKSTIPWAPDVPRYTVIAPRISQPGGTITEKDQLGGFDTENEDIIKLMNARPDIADHIFEYNELVNQYNNALNENDRTRADQLRSEMRKSSQMIVGEAALKPATVGLGKSAKDIQQSMYTGKTISGKYGTFYAHKTKNARTTRLGLDRDIDEYNYLADRLNEDIYQERTEIAGVRNEFNMLNYKINAVEIEPEYGIGRSNAKFISEQYPERVRELAEKALKYEPLNLSPSEEQMLKEYPEIGRPLLKLDEFQKHMPPGSVPNQEIMNGLRSVNRLKNLDYKLPKARPFAEGGHRVSPVLQRLIDRIANDTQESQKTFIVTKEERMELERFPDLKAKVERYEYETKRLNELYANPNQELLPGELGSGSVSDYFRTLQSEGYRTSEPAEYSMAELDAKLRDDRAAVEDAYTNFKIAQGSGASRADLAQAYQRLNIAKSRLAADEHDAAGRGTFLAERSRELLPKTEAELKKFQQLQAVEAALQGEPNVLLEYNRGISEVPFGAFSPEQYYEYRLKLLRDAAARAGVSQTYDQAISQAGQPMDETIVNLPDDAAATERQGEGTERASTVDPDESKLFMMSGAQNRKQFQNWLKFSYVAPGFGLGGPAQNPLARCNASMDSRRFAHAQNVPAHTRKPMPRPHEDPMRYQQWINPTVSSFGRVHMKDPFHDNYVDSMSKRVIWSNPFGDINSTRDVRRSESIYDPDYTDFRYDELTGTRYGSHPVRIGEISKPAEYRFTNERYYDTNGFNYKQQNELNLFAPEGDLTMITKDRAGLDDRGIIENRKDWHTYGRTRMRPLGAPGFRSTKF